MVVNYIIIMVVKCPLLVEIVGKTSVSHYPFDDAPS